MKVIYFNKPACPSNMGQSQKTDNVEQFVEERKDLFPNAKITSDRLTFDVKEGEKQREGYAIIFDCPTDFQN